MYTAPSKSTRQPSLSPNAPATRRPIVVYDGQCPYCRKQIARMRSMDSRNVFDYIPRQEPGLNEQFPILEQQDFNTGMRLIHPDGSVDVGADAVYQIARRLPRVAWITWVYRVPGIHWTAQRVYAWIARNRQRLSATCTDESCKL